jgi:hypothetical protein
MEISPIVEKYPETTLPWAVHAAFWHIFGKSFRIVAAVSLALFLSQFLTQRTTLLLYSATSLLVATVRFFWLHTTKLRFLAMASYGPVFWGLTQTAQLANGPLGLQLLLLGLALVALAVYADFIVDCHVSAVRENRPHSETLTDIIRDWEDRWRILPREHSDRAAGYDREAELLRSKEKFTDAMLAERKAEMSRALAAYPLGYAIFAAAILAALFLATRSGNAFYAPMKAVLFFIALLWVSSFPASGRLGLSAAIRALADFFPTANPFPSTDEKPYELWRLGTWLAVFIIFPCSAYFPLHPYVNEDAWVKAASVVAARNGFIDDGYAYLTKSPGTWLNLYVGTGTPTAILLAPVLSFFTYGLILPFLIIPLYSLLIGRTLHSFDQGAITTIDELEKEAPPKTWEEIVEKLQNSNYEKKTKYGVARLRDHLYLGRNVITGAPVLLDRAILREHAWISGDPGTGKTARGIAPLSGQLIRMNGRIRPGTADQPCSVVIVDLKGDRALFHNTRIEAERAGIPFRWFTSTYGRETYVFNPFLQSYVQNVHEDQFSGNLLQAMGLEYGAVYGRAHFSQVNRRVLAPVLSEHGYKIRSMRDLDKSLMEFQRTKGKSVLEAGGEQLAKEASHLFGVVNSLSTFEALNVVPGQVKKSITDRALDMSQLFVEPQAFYFNLPAIVGGGPVKELARLMLFSLLTAADDWLERNKTGLQCYLFIDEFQQLVSDNISIFLDQARSKNIGVIMANQHRGQLRTIGLDILSTVETSAFKMEFGASGSEAKKAIVDSSGEAFYDIHSWGMSESRSERDVIIWGTGRFIEPETKKTIGTFQYPKDSGLATTTTTGSSHTTQESIGPRIRPNTVAEVSDNEDLAFVEVSRGRGFTRYKGQKFVLETTFHISGEEYKRREQLEWPSDEHTIRPHGRYALRPRPEKEKKGEEQAELPAKPQQKAITPPTSPASTPEKSEAPKAVENPEALKFLEETRRAREEKRKSVMERKTGRTRKKKSEQGEPPPSEKEEAN